MYIYLCTLPMYIRSNYIIGIPFLSGSPETSMYASPIVSTLYTSNDSIIESNMVYISSRKATTCMKWRELSYYQHAQIPRCSLRNSGSIRDAPLYSYSSIDITRYAATHSAAECCVCCRLQYVVATYRLWYTWVYNRLQYQNIHHIFTFTPKKSPIHVQFVYTDSVASRILPYVIIITQVNRKNVSILFSSPP